MPDARIYDLIAAWPDDGDNPFPSKDERLLNKLRAYRDANVNEFRFINDWKNNLHSREIFEPVEDDLDSICDVKLNNLTSLSDIPQLDYAVKRFFNQNSSLGFSPSMMQWAQSVGGGEAQNDELSIDTIDEENEQIENSAPLNAAYNDAVNEFANVIPDIDSTTAIIPANETATYNWASNYTITYQELEKICLNQARKSLISSKARSLEIEKAEIKRRNELTISINKYFDLNEIAIDLNAREIKFDKMTIAELEILLQQCESKFDSLKTKELFKNGLTLIELGYNSLFPDGIPITKDKRIIIDKSVPKQLQNALFDVRSVPGQAFRQIIDKLDMHIPNGVTVGIEIVKTICKGSKIVDKHDVKIEEIEDEGSEEQSSEQSAEEELEDISYED